MFVSLFLRKKHGAGIVRGVEGDDDFCLESCG